ncbi:hypothetical protein RRG08_023744 [Elysia crispata]|uniref:Uncharacterized protein n=1 Tax=Elysia crispata TaxID=231223 RepID=A0AAE0ZWQ4_9GAST|nr:hypothetical protein RRG08_023744 [Elysia crispata]
MTSPVTSRERADTVDDGSGQPSETSSTQLPLNNLDQLPDVTKTGSMQTRKRYRKCLQKNNSFFESIRSTRPHNPRRMPSPTVLNRQASVNDEAIDRLPQVEPNPELDNLPTEEEVRQAVKLLSRGKAPGSDAIPAEVYKAEGPVMIQRLTQLFRSIWREEKVATVQGCQYRRHLQEERQPPFLRQLHRHFPPVHSLEDLGSCTAQMSPSTPQTRSPPRKPVGLPRRTWDMTAFLLRANSRKNARNNTATST